jgi:hypothetical protein
MSRTRQLIAMAAIVLIAVVAAMPADAAITTKKKVGDKEIKVTAYGFMQYEARAGKGFGENDGIRFQAQRVRLGTNFFVGKVFGKLFLDFNQSHDNREGGLPKMIKDGFVGYKWNNAAFVKIGMFKTPLGMSFTIPGWNLDNIERNGLDKGLVLERDFGVMLSGRLIGGPADQEIKVNGTEMGHERWGKGFGYDIGMFNPAGRSTAVVWDSDVLGDALAWAGRVHYDYGPYVHVEVSYGVSEQAGGYDTDDYKVWDIGVNSFLVDNKLNLKAEYIHGDNIRGRDGHEQDCLSLTVGYMVHKQIEAVVKHYWASVTWDDSYMIDDTSLGNTYLGVNFYLQPLKYKPRALQNHKIVLNYVLISGDQDDWTGGSYNGEMSQTDTWGYTDSVFMAQYQYKF